MNPHAHQVVRLFEKHFDYREIIGIEIGTGEAEVTEALLLSLPSLTKLYTVDPYLYCPGGEFEAAQGDQEWHNQRKNRAVKCLIAYLERCEQLCITSDEAAILTPSSVDFVWIDGDHTNSQIVKDIRNYYPKVKPGGILGGHDYHRVYPALVNEPELKNYLIEPIHEGADLTWWLFK